MRLYYPTITWYHKRRKEKRIRKIELLDTVTLVVIYWVRVSFPQQSSEDHQHHVKQSATLNNVLWRCVNLDFCTRVLKRVPDTGNVRNRGYIRMSSIDAIARGGDTLNIDIYNCISRLKNRRNGIIRQKCPRCDESRWRRKIDKWIVRPKR